jgi:beta-ribofuranosylaminobenzene 5'-phosphate synthase
MATIRVEASARLHLGMFDLSGSLGRRFGGIGVAIAQPSLVVEAGHAVALSVTGPECERVFAFAQRYLAARGLVGGAELVVARAIPAHVGLGSGTKLALAVARALAELYQQPTDPYELALAVGRGQRSAIGLWTFASGGLILEGGRREAGGPAPLLARYVVPPAWRCVLAIPDAPAGLHGAAEVRAFATLDPGADPAAAISHQVLMALLPGLVAGDVGEFGRALTTVQRLVGECFSPAQGATFANSRSAALVEGWLAAGAPGAGQSSWGPAVYAVAADEREAQRLARVAEDLLAGQGSVAVVPFDNVGARVSWT